MRFTTNAILMLECALSAFIGNPATCQTPSTQAPLAIGTRVRVGSSAPWFSEPRITANVLGQRGDTLFVQPEGTQDSIPLPLGSITQLEVSAGRSRHVGKGMGLGLLGGALAGVVFGAALTRRARPVLTWVEELPLQHTALWVVCSEPSSALSSARERQRIGRESQTRRVGSGSDLHRLARVASRCPRYSKRQD